MSVFVLTALLFLRNQIIMHMLVSKEENVICDCSKQ